MSDTSSQWVRYHWSVGEISQVSISDTTGQVPQVSVSDITGLWVVSDTRGLSVMSHMYVLCVRNRADTTGHEEHRDELT